MAFITWQASVQDDVTGAVVVSPVVTVRNEADDSDAAIYDMSGVQITNPITGSANGFVQFQVKPGVYTIEGVKSGSNTDVHEWTAGPFNYDTRAELVTAIANDTSFKDGDIITDSVNKYIYQTGDTSIADLPGLIDNGTIKESYLWSGYWVGEGLDSTGFIASNTFGNAVYVGWDQFRMQTPTGTRSIAAQSRYRLEPGWCLYVTISDSTPLPVTAASYNSTIGQMQADNEIVVLVHNTDGAIAGPLQGILTGVLDRQKEPRLSVAQAGAQAALWHNQQSVYNGASAFEINLQTMYRYSPPWYDTKLSFPRSAGNMDLSNFPSGATVTVNSEFGCTVFAGRGRTFAGQTGNLVDYPQNSVFRITRVAADNDEMIVVEDLVNTGVYTTITEPVRDFSIALGGQSHAVYMASRSGMGGFQDALVDADYITGGEDITDSFNVVSGGTSGSAILKTTSATNYWWDDTLDVPGPALTSFLGSVDSSTAAGQPLPEFVLWMQGDAEAWALRSGTVTVDAMKNGIKSVWAYIQANKLPNAEFCVVIPGSNDSPTNQIGMAGVRRAYMLAIGEVAYAHQGPEMFDLPRPFNEIHLFNTGYYELGRRVAKHYINIMNAGTQDLGPEVDTVTMVDSQTIEVTFTGTVEFPASVIDEDFAVWDNNPFGFMVLPSGYNGSQNEIDLIWAKWDGTTLTLKSKAGLTGGRVMFPEGWMESVWKFQFPHDGDATALTRGLPLRSYMGSEL